MTIGSYVPPGTPGNQVLSAKVLTANGIMAVHNLTVQEFKKMRKRLFNMKLSDIMFHFPSGPRYDLALNMIATL
jgi:hypothetical protein